MKKILLIFLACFSLSVPVFAEELPYIAYTDVPDQFYTFPEVSLFTGEPDYEMQLYSFLNATINDLCDGGVMTQDYLIDVSDFNILTTASSAETLTANDLLNIYSSVVYDNPQYGNLRTGFRYGTDGTGTYITVIVPLYRPLYNEAEYQSKTTDEERAAYLDSHHNQEEFLKAIEYAFSAAISPDMTEDWQKALSIHNYLVDSAYYSPSHVQPDSLSQEEAKNPELVRKYEEACAAQKAEEKNFDAATNDLVHTTYSALVARRETVCQGYSLAFKLLCEMAGIECGYARYPGHVWNVVKIGDNYYHTDLTWDDPAKVSGSGYICPQQHSYYKFFLLSDAQLEKNHPDWTSPMPECSDSSLHTSLFGGELDTLGVPLLWENGQFWYEGINHYLDEEKGELYHKPSGKYYTLPDATSPSVAVPDKASYLPGIRLEAKMHTPVIIENSHGFVAIDGTPNTTAQLYAARFAGDRFADVDIVDIEFDEYGKTVASFPFSTNKLMIFQNGTIVPIAYAK